MQCVASQNHCTEAKCSANDSTNHCTEAKCSANDSANHCMEAKCSANDSTNHCTEAKCSAIDSANHCTEAKCSANDSTNHCTEAKCSANDSTNHCTEVKCSVNDSTNHCTEAKSRLRTTKKEHNLLTRLCFDYKIEANVSLLFPLDGRGRFRRDIVANAVDTLHLADDFVRNIGHEVIRQVCPVSRHGIHACHCS